MSKNFSSIIISILCVLLLCSCGNKDNSKLILATSDCGNVSGADFFTEWNGYSQSTKNETRTYDDYFKIVRKIALQKIIYSHALADKLDQDETVAAKLVEIQKTIGYNILHENNVTKKVKVLESDFNKYKKSYTLYQIVRRTDTLDENRIAKSRSIMKNLASSIKTLEEFKKAATQYSEDITSSKAGFMGQIRRGLLEDELDNGLAKLSDGQMSDVIETNTGLHLLFVEKITTSDLNTLIYDKGLYDQIANEKKAELETAWYKKILKNSKLSFHKELFTSKADDDTVIVQYEDATITKKEIDDTVYSLRQNGAFPEPTKDEYDRLIDNMALNLVINHLAIAPEITCQKEYIEKYEKQKVALLQDEFISRSLSTIEPEESEIREFYLANKVRLFTFKDGNKETVQREEDVRDFIISKLQEQSVKNQKYALYRAQVNSAHFKANEKNINLLMDSISKSK